MKAERNFLKDELKRIDDQIGHYSYGGNIGTIKRIEELWELRRDIVNEVGKEKSKEESSFLKAELKMVETQIRAYQYGGNKETLDKIKKLFELRKIIMEEIKTREAKGPQVLKITSTKDSKKD